MTENLTDTNVGNIEYIRKADAVDAVNHALDRETILFSFVRKVAISALKKIAPADVAPVIRCKECMHYVQETPYRGYCTDTHSFGRYWRPDDFCSYGEKGEE